MDTAVFRAWITSAADVIEANRDHLTQLDAAGRRIPATMQ